MRKDLQAGSEYWSGCFNFSNIICDGRPSDVQRARDGGLKMGGTYWYHYRINDLTDFHNVCERATTNCPLMPGQLVNVLNVPYALSGNRSRNPSTSSTSSERRTMDPQDKFMNPRPAPIKPKLLRVSTSPTLNDFPEDNDATPMKEGPNASRFLRLPKKRSVDSYTTSPSGGLANGLRAAFKIRTARSQSPEQRPENEKLNHRRSFSLGPSTNPEASNESEARRPVRGLLLRTASDESIPTLSFEQHRRQRSRSRDATPSRDANLNDQQHHIEPLTLMQSNYATLDTLKEVASKENTPIDEIATQGALTKLELDLEKRLPTLPNTPSSAYPLSFNEDSPRRYPGMEDELLNSHFSATTIDTEYHPLSAAYKERSHFSAWTTTTGTSSVFFDESVPPLPEFPGAFLSEDGQLHLESPTRDDFLSSNIGYSSVSSSVSTTPSTSILDTDAEFEAAMYRAQSTMPGTATSQIQHYSLPEYDYASQTTLKAPFEESRGRSRHPVYLNVDKQNVQNSQNNQIIHSESMQKLLDELSYLSDMIQN